MKKFQKISGRALLLFFFCGLAVVLASDRQGSQQNGKGQNDKGQNNQGGQEVEGECVDGPLGPFSIETTTGERLGTVSFRVDCFGYFVSEVTPASGFSLSVQFIHFGVERPRGGPETFTFQSRNRKFVAFDFDVACGEDRFLVFVAVFVGRDGHRVFQGVAVGDVFQTSNVFGNTNNDDRNRWPRSAALAAGAGAEEVEARSVEERARGGHGNGGGNGHGNAGGEAKPSGRGNGNGHGRPDGVPGRGGDGGDRGGRGDRDDRGDRDKGRHGHGDRDEDRKHRGDRDDKHGNHHHKKHHHHKRPKPHKPEHRPENRPEHKPKPRPPKPEIPPPNLPGDLGVLSVAIVNFCCPQCTAQGQSFSCRPKEDGIIGRLGANCCSGSANSYCAFDINGNAGCFDNPSCDNIFNTVPRPFKRCTRNSECPEGTRCQQTLCCRGYEPGVTSACVPICRFC